MLTKKDWLWGTSRDDQKLAAPQTEAEEKYMNSVKKHQT